MRKPLIAGNWKMYKTITEALNLVNGLKREISEVEAVDVVVCPPYTALAETAEALIDSNMRLGAQDIFWQVQEGAYTGAVSGTMLRDAGCTYVIIGHSERRQYFYETNESVNKKIQAALACGLNPIVCIGETLAQRDENKTIAVINEQLKEGLKAFDAECAGKLVIAYEPVWAIGTGKTATPAQAQEVHSFIRQWLRKHYGDTLAAGARILYGGSVKPANIEELMREGDIDGALVGGASLEVSSFSDIVRKSITKEVV